jgi:hypothetical protein
MAVYKVPQDVEADDKLLGPFSFRQFIYLIIVAIAIAIAWGLSRLFIPLAIIPLPVIIFFGALALPLRKDQPMEIYLAAIVSFYLKPRKRLWQADGIQSLIEITVPKVVEIQRSKNLTQSEAERRLSYLADIVDTGGWAIRGVGGAPQTTSPMQNEVFFEAQQAEDILSNDGGVSRSFDTMITQSDQRHRQEVMDRMRQTNIDNTPPPPPPPVTTSTLADPYATFGVPTQPANLPTDPSVFSTPAPAPAEITSTHVTFNPYPNAMHQSVITPLSQQAAPAVITPPVPTQAPQQPAIIAPPVVPQPQPAPITTSEKVVSPDIINLANNPDLSIATIQHEANRIRQQEIDETEVVISLR